MPTSPKGLGSLFHIRAGRVPWRRRCRDLDLSVVYCVMCGDGIGLVFVCSAAVGGPSQPGFFTPCLSPLHSSPKPARCSPALLHRLLTTQRWIKSTLSKIELAKISINNLGGVGSSKKPKEQVHVHVHCFCPFKCGRGGERDWLFPA